ncbi:MAG: hypothetical protein K0R50_1312 [Eubacterium sp.]|jgi:hypothetical protein|nr:hypothetical protein [Eubacterium sp.]
MIFEVAGFISLMGLLSFLQIRHMHKKEGIKAVLVYALFMTIATVIGSLLIAGVQLQGQSVIDRLFEPIGKAVLGS